MTAIEAGSHSGGPNAWSVAKAAYLAPFANPLGVLRAFWHVIVAYAVLIAFNPVQFEQPVPLDPNGEANLMVPRLETVVFFVLLGIYVWLLAMRGAVAWHRHIILGERIAWTPPVPSWHGLRYGLWGLVIALIVGLVAGVFATFVFVPLSFLEGDSISISSNGTLAMGAFGTAVNALLSAAVQVLLILLLARVAMWLPQVAVEAADNDWDHRVPVRSILLATAVPLAFVSALIQPAPDTGVNAIAVMVALQMIVGGYRLLVALSGLSLAFRLRHSGSEFATA